MIRPITPDDVRAAIGLEGFDVATAHRLMSPQPRVLDRPATRPGQPRQASVLLLVFPAEDGLSLLLTRRAEHPNDVHSGQISLPGGSQEPGETPIETALREAREEVGFAGEAEILGLLTPIYIPPSDFYVHPVAAYVDYRPAWSPDPREVVAVIECPVITLLNDALKVIEDWNVHNTHLRVPWYNVNGHQVWGATAIILSEFEQRLRAVLQGGAR